MSKKTMPSASDSAFSPEEAADPTYREAYEAKKNEPPEVDEAETTEPVHPDDTPVAVLESRIGNALRHAGSPGSVIGTGSPTMQGVPDEMALDDKCAATAAGMGRDPRVVEAILTLARWHGPKMSAKVRAILSGEDCA